MGNVLHRALDGLVRAVPERGHCAAGKVERELVVAHLPGAVKH